MRFLLDQGLPRSAARLLRDEGIDTLHVGDIEMSTAEDVEILERGRQDQQTIVTLDAYFHAILALSGAISPSVIRIRIEGLRAACVKVGNSLLMASLFTKTAPLLLTLNSRDRSRNGGIRN